jgi:hypothetical protein
MGVDTDLRMDGVYAMGMVKSWLDVIPSRWQNEMVSCCMSPWATAFLFVCDGGERRRKRWVLDDDCVPNDGGPLSVV